MQTLLLVIQAIVGFGILNVWLLRRNKATAFRGGLAQSMEEEFKHYGLPEWSVSVVGFSKVSLAFLILAGYFNPTLTALGATALGLFMLGAVLLHIKVRDTFVKTLPSLLMLVMCGILAMGSSPDILSIAAIQ